MILNTKLYNSYFLMPYENEILFNNIRFCETFKNIFFIT